MSLILLNDPNDIDWLRDVHLPGLPDAVNAAVLEGNEDSPDAIWTYTAQHPTVHDRSTLYVPDSEGNYSLA